MVAVVPVPAVLGFWAEELLFMTLAVLGNFKAFSTAASDFMFAF